MKHLFHVAVLIGLMAALTGCSEKLDPQPATYSQLLTGSTSKTWRLSSVQVLSKGQQPANISASRFGCEGDDLYVFYADAEKSFEVTEGASSCEAGDPDLVVENTWSLVNANATLIFVVPLLTSSPLPFVVKSLTQTNLTVELYFEDEDDTSYQFLFTSQGG